MNTITAPISGRAWRLAAALFAVLLTLSAYQAAPSSASPPQQAQATALGLQSPRYLGTLNGIIYLGGVDPVYGNELWSTDGTPQGTTLVKDFDSTIVCPAGSPPQCDPSDSMPGDGWIIGGRLAVEANGALWATDGSVTGTVKLVQYVGGTRIVQQGDALYVPARVDQPGTAYRLLRTDGTISGTVELAEFAAIHSLRGDGDRLLMLADVGLGAELWQSDGTAAGTAKLADAGAITMQTKLAVANGRIYWQASHPAMGHALWSSDGTPAGTGVVMDLAPGTAPAWQSQMIAYGGRLYFAGDDGQGEDLWRTDGTVTGTIKLAELCPTGEACGRLREEFEIHRGRLFFTLSSAAGTALWASGGTNATTRQIVPPSPRPQFDLQSWGGQTYLLHAPPQPTLQVTLLATDGTPAGTRQALILPGDIAAASLEPGPDAMIMSIRAGSTLNVYATQGTTATTRLIQSHSNQPVEMHLARYLPGRLVYGTRLGLWSLPYTSTLTHGVWLPRLDLAAAR